jgi:ABC-type nitrate/sulfonate/bicarbonate transport system substrate-binding protein
MYIHMGFLIAFLASLLFNCSVAAQDKPKIFVGAASKTLGYSPFWVGVKKGFFDQQGLDVQLVLLRGVPMTVQALSAGSLQIGSGGPEPYIAASERGLDYVITGGIINGLTHFIMAGKNYKTYEDLRGATLGSSSLTGGIVTGMKEALRLKGFEYPRDYKILVVAGGSSGNLAALQSGQIAATTIAVPLNFSAEDLGFNAIGRLMDGVPNFQVNSVVVSRSWAQKNREVMVRFMNAVVQSLHWLYDNRDAAVEFLSKEMKLKPAHALKGWEFYTQNHIWPYDGEPSIEGMKVNIRVYAEQTGAKGPLPDVHKFVDMSYLNDALKELGKR